MVFATKFDAKNEDKKPSSMPYLWRRQVLVSTLGLLLLCGITYLIFILVQRSAQTVERSFSFEPNKFKRVYKQMCNNSKYPSLEYKGVESFFEYVKEPNIDACYSWVEFGGEKIIIPGQTQTECSDEIRKTKYICFNKEYEMTKDPCLVYSFRQDEDKQFERDMNMFSCEVHSFDHEQVSHENVKRSEFWFEHAWDISEYPYDHSGDGSVVKRRSLDFIVRSLGHEHKTIKYLKSDLEGREWILLRQIVAHTDIVDIQQIGVQIHIPSKVNNMTGSDRHSFFADLFQIFQGLQCAGYRYIQGRPVTYYKGKIQIPEIKEKFYPSYELNFAKIK